MVTRETAIDTARSFIRECKMNGLSFYKVLIFGSVAKGRIHEWSDILSKPTHTQLIISFKEMASLMK